MNGLPTCPTVSSRLTASCSFDLNAIAEHASWSIVTTSLVYPLERDALRNPLWKTPLHPRYRDLYWYPLGAKEKRKVGAQLKETRVILLKSFLF